MKREMPCNRCPLGNMWPGYCSYPDNMCDNYYSYRETTESMKLKRAEKEEVK